MYLNHLSTQAAKAYSRDLFAQAEQDRRLALLGRSQLIAPAMRAATRRMIHPRPTAD